MRAKNFKIIAFLGATLCALLLSELLFRGYFSIVQNYDIEMWRYARLLKTPVNDARSHIHIPNASARIMGADVHINSHGLRDREYSYNKPAGVTRILLIGDSLTFGFGVKEEDTFARIIEQKLNEGGTRKYEVINAGVGNYNTEQELAFYTTEGVKYHSDIVILGWYINDAEPTQKYPETFLTQNSITYVFMESMYNRLRAFLQVGNGYEEYYQSLYTPERWAVYQKTLFAFGHAVTQSGAKLAVVLLPELHTLNPYPFAAIDKEVSSEFIRQGVQVLDTTSAFKDSVPQDMWVAYDDVHPNSRANALIANDMLKYLNFRP